MYPDRPLQAKLAERMDGVQKNKECLLALFELFSHCCKGLSGEESRECRKAKSPNGKAGECRKAQSPSPRVKIVLTPANQAPPKVKIVRAPKHYSAAYRVSLLRHPPVGNTRSRTKPQIHTPRINTSRAIDFGQERKRLKSPPTHWSRAIAPEIQTLETI